ncbi:MAG: GAF domain-containing sensor histidine kinase [Chloroflexota bacterium]|nr:GAF domain-containing sensor histidine kinase [Chloroflexota bacterium]
MAKGAQQRARVGPGEGDERPPRRDRTRELVILNAIAEALNSAPDVGQALGRTLTLVADLLGLRTGWIWLLDRETGQFYSAAAQHLPPYLQEPVRMTGKHCWCIESFLAGDLAPRNIDVLECSRLRGAVQDQAADLTQGLRYHASIPLYFGDTPLGIMNVTGPSWRELTREELRLLSTIAYQVGIAIERARLAEESTRLARAEERARLAREIHDGLAQGLTAIGLDLEGGLHHLEGNPARARERLERALTTTRASLEEARRSVLDLRSAPLAGKPLPEALAALGRAFTSETGVRVQVQVGGNPRLPLRMEAELFRIAGEALANVRRHARAKRVAIALRVAGRTVRLSIRDDGQGFDPRGPEAGQEGRYGILGMRERARLLGGSLRVESRPGRGTTVRATVPLPEEIGQPAEGGAGV